MIELLAALPGIAAIGIGIARWRAWRYPERGWRRSSPRARLVLFASFALAIGACHSIDSNVYAHAPVSTAVLPLNEPLRYSNGTPVPSQNGLLASYFAGANYERLDHQQIDPNVNFVWDATGNPVISAPDGIDHNDGDFRLPDSWGIWSVVWEGYLDAPTADTYGLRIHVNNGGWLQLKDGAGALTVVIDCRGGTGFEGDCDANAALAQGRNYIRMSYFNNAPPSAKAILSWRPPGAADFSVIPTESLFTQAAPIGNTVPTVSLTCPQQAFIHDGAIVRGSFVDPDAGQTWTATFDGFNQAAPAPLDLASDHTFVMTVRAPLIGAGTFHVVIVVTDSAGATGQADCTIVAVPKRVMIYLHGTTGSFEQIATSDTSNFPSLFKRLAARYDFRFYEYYEDAGNQGADFFCKAGKRRDVPVVIPGSGMPFDLPGPDPDPGICDSNDDVELNALILDGDIRSLAKDFDKVTLLSNSGGTRIVRAYLAYANAVASSSLGFVDLVVSLQGAQAGSYIAAVYDMVDPASDNPDKARTRDALLDQVKPIIKHDPRRPLFQDMRPGSPNIEYTNKTVSIPDGPHYLNVDGDMRLRIIQSYFLIPLQTDRYDIGDIVFLPGSDDPTATPDTGGALFLPSVVGRGASSSEWELSRDFDVNIDPTPLGFFVFTNQIGDIIGAPESHVNLGKRLDQICVRYKGVSRLDAVLFDQIAALDSGLPPAPGRLGLGRAAEVRCP